MLAPLPRRVLLAAHNGIVGMIVADELELAGYEVVGPFGSAHSATTALGRDPPDLAVIDAVLDDGPGLAVARELAARGIPFVVLTSWPRSRPIAPELDAVPWVSSPCPAEDVVAAVGSLLPRPSLGP